MRIVDTKGQLCPAPLIATKRALKETRAGESFQVLIDNRTSLNNVSRFLKDNNTTFLVGESEGIWTLTIERTTGEATRVNAEDYCAPAVPHFKKGDFIVVITSDRMGDGDDELGHLLMNNFIRALMDLDKLPQKMVFYNKGVTLLAEDSHCIAHLKDLENMGVEILLCATCVDHYALTDKTGAGILSNMFTIAEVMSTAGSIVRP